MIQTYKIKCAFFFSKKKKEKKIKCAFGICLKSHFFLFSLFLLLFMGSITLFGTIHMSYCTISATF